MIDAQLLLTDLKTLLKKLEADLLARCKDNPTIEAQVRTEYDAAKRANRTAQSYEEWRTDFITQAAVAWILACVFVRFIEDNRLLDEPHEARAWLAGPQARLQRAQDRHTVYFREHPTHSDREYLAHVFHAVGNPSGQRPVAVVQALFDERHNPLWKLGVSGDGATLLLNFWQQREAASGELKHDFTDSEWNTRFLGDLYQDLSEAARKKYALLQTPVFVEEFILDRTLTPAIHEFGYEQVRLIDPTCGSGHFLLGAFARLFDLHLKHHPTINARELAQRALRSVYGVDVNPFAVAIARFRLLMAALRAAETNRLQDAPAFAIHLATGDALLHGQRHGNIRGVAQSMFDDQLQHHYETEDKDALDQILGQQYHAVVGNPPYITVKDKALNQAYRDRYGSCHMKYSLAVPFMERFFELVVGSQLSVVGSEEQPATDNRQPTTGFVGMITANSFMKREFGKKLIEQFIPLWDVTHVIDTSGAYIPGHGTPTVILLGRNRRPLAATIRTVMGIKGEPSTPADPAFGQVWRSIVENVDVAGAQTEFVSVADTQRESFHRHPWSIGGGGAAELKELIDEVAERKLESLADSIGITSFTLEDDVYLLPRSAAKRHRMIEQDYRQMVEGEMIRDWSWEENNVAVFPYNANYEPIEITSSEPVLKYLWRARNVLSNNIMFGGKTKVDCGLRWYEFGRLTAKKLRTPLAITFAEVATHNHFVLDRGGKVFKQTAPVIKLPSEATEADHLALLGLLNSSTGCFWMQKVFHNKGGPGGANSKDEKWHDFYQHSGTALKQFPIPQHKPLALARTLDQLAQRLQSLLPTALAQAAVPQAAAWQQAQQEAEQLRRQMIAWQEELDWACYELYGLIEEQLSVVGCQLSVVSNQSPATDEHPGRDDQSPTTDNWQPTTQLGERAFEIVLARKLAAGEVATTWFARHGSTPITELPAHWPDDYRQLVERRIAAIETNANIRLIEQPEYKRRWNTERWDVQAQRALGEWLLNRMEDARYWTETQLTSVARLSDRIRTDPEWMQVAEMYRGRADFDVLALVTELVKAEAVPFLPVFRYKASGLEKRRVWERTWEMQREEDKGIGDWRLEIGDANPKSKIQNPKSSEIPVPPKYKSSDFRDTNYWRLRGKLDVPKERFISYPNCEREVDPTLVIGWAGWDHLQQAQALAEYYTRAKEQEGWSTARLVPLLSGLVELLPWLKQWHNEMDAQYGMGLGDFFEEFIAEEARNLGLTMEKMREWEPGE